MTLIQGTVSECTQEECALTAVPAIRITAESGNHREQLQSMKGSITKTRVSISQSLACRVLVGTNSIQH